MAITTTDRVFTVEASEYGYSTEQLPVAGTGSINLYIPKIMGSLSGNGPDSNAADSIFDNDSSCKPSFAKKVTMKDTLNVPLELNGLWAAHLNSKGVIPKGSTFRVNFVNENVHDPRATTS